MWQFAFTCCDKITTGCRRTVKSNVKENEYNKQIKNNAQHDKVFSLHDRQCRTGCNKYEIIR